MRMIATHYIFTQDYSNFFSSFLLIDGGLRCGVIEVIYDCCKILSMLACVMLSTMSLRACCLLGLWDQLLLWEGLKYL